MSKKGGQWCAVPGCMTVDKDKRHFFRFPKEHDRWLKWINASKRLDLVLKGPDYAYRNCTMCHYHFEEKWLRRKTVTRLHPDAIPTIFFGPAFDRDDIQFVKNLPTDVDANCININNVDAMHSSNMDADNKNAVNVEAEQSTSRSMQKTKESSDKSPRKEKLLKQVMKLRKQNNNLRQTVRRLRIKQEKKKATEKEVNDIKNMRELSEDETIGFEDTGYEKPHKPAKRDLVLMARSIVGN